MTTRADRWRGHIHGGLVGQGPMIQLSMDNTHSRTALLFCHHLARGSCNRAIGRKGGTILSRSPALHNLDHPRRRLIAFLLGQDREGKTPSQFSAWICGFLGVANGFCCQIRLHRKMRNGRIPSGYMEPDVPITTSAVHTGLGFIRS